MPPGAPLAIIYAILETGRNAHMPALDNISFSKVRGFGYQPSYGSNGMEIWTNFNLAKIETEIALCKKHFPKTNMLRLWLSFDAFIKEPELFRRNFDSLLEVVARNGMQSMPALFNNWHSIPDFGGVAPEMIRYWNHPSRCHVFTGYLDAVVKPHASDARILAWDLCNEPFNSGADDVFLPWLKLLAGHCRSLGAKAPITIGVPASVDALKSVEPLCDVLTPHCYFAKGLWSKDEESFKRTLDGLVDFANSAGKPMFAGETGWGELDDSRRADLLCVELQSLAERKMGFCIHMLNHSLVADGHRPEYGVVSEAGFMGCIEADGSMRNGHGLINEMP